MRLKWFDFWTLLLDCLLTELDEKVVSVADPKVTQGRGVVAVDKGEAERAAVPERNGTIIHS